MSRETKEGVDPQKFAQSVRALLEEDRRRYRNFGVFWFFVKALLRRFYDRHEMPYLGPYVDQAVVDRMPQGLDAHAYIDLAIGEYQENATTNMLSNHVRDPDGEVFVLNDPDIDG